MTKYIIIIGAVAITWAKWTLINGNFDTSMDIN